MAATFNLVAEAFLRLSRNDTTLTTLDLSDNQVGDEGAGRFAEALITNSTLTQVRFYCDPKIRCLVDAHLDRNKANLEKKSASLFLMLLPLLSLDNDELSEETALSLDVSPSSKLQRRT